MAPDESNDWLDYVEPVFSVRIELILYAHLNHRTSTFPQAMQQRCDKLFNIMLYVMKVNTISGKYFCAQ